MAIIVALQHLVLAIVLIRAFALDVTTTITDKALQAFTITPSKRPTVRLSAPPPSSASPEGAAGNAGRRVVPRSVAAPRAPIVLPPMPAPPVVGTGPVDRAGAAAQGLASGASGVGTASGSGAAGVGQGAGGAGRGAGRRPTVKIAGDINSAKDYPRKSRDRRIGASVTIDLAIDSTGRVADCTVVQPSPDPVADAITCDLATHRFRFRPALDATGTEISSVFRWRQQWYY
ncbi:TonB family protein [Novosphingobium sp. Rr 2-17]|uniref:TonB family protein n=1 Tax=Novosphingobium sp. Rr 2-17 TaxID=555793 RepID=UPI0002D5515F|nr:TonB family protein [Novosphingobium sp. Rr 2-17]